MDTKCADRFAEIDRIFAVSSRAPAGSRNLIFSSVCMILIEVIEKREERRKAGGGVLPTEGR